MRHLELFFDYACPYCLRAHELLLELLPLHSDIEIDWRPCESHPRPDSYGPHSDLCIRGMYFARAHGADLLEYHRLMYRAALIERADIEDPLLSPVRRPRCLMPARWNRHCAADGTSVNCRKRTPMPLTVRASGRCRPIGWTGEGSTRAKISA